MNQASHTASSTSPSGDEALCIDPQVLRLHRDQNPVTSPSATSTLSTGENDLGATSRSSDETTAGRGPRRHNDSASLMIGRHGSVNTLGRSSNGLPLWSDAPGVDSSLATQYNNATRLGDTWSKYSLTPHEVDPSPVTIPAGLRRAAKHKYTLVSCCAEHCEQTFLRKDHLTQHIRNKHQDLDSKFRCPVYGCADRSIHLHDLLIHMKQAGHQGDMHFTSIKNAAEKPKCACGDGLIISDRCKACGFQSV